MSGYGFVAKGWSVTLSTAILGLAVKDGGPDFLWVGALAVIMFWLIDAYYLALERGFRDIFATAVADYASKTAESFNMTPSLTLGGLIAAAFRPAALMVHPPLLVAFLLAFVFIKKLL